MLGKLMTIFISRTFSAVVTIASLVLAIVVYRKNKEKKVFSYCLRSSSLIRKKERKFEKLSVTYAGEQIDNLCVSRFTIWNSGNKTLNASDMVDSKELAIIASEESRILDAELIACSDETNKFSVQIVDEHVVKIPFDYVDRREGVVVQILHTGTDETLKIDCKIKGGLPIRNFINESVPRIINRATSRTMKWFPFVFIVAILLLFVFALYQTLSACGVDLRTMLFGPSPEAVAPVHESKSTTDSHVLLGILWFYSLVYLAIGIPTLKAMFMLGMPSSLKKHSRFGD